MPNKNTPTSLFQMRTDILAVKKQLIRHCLTAGFIPELDDFKDLVVLREEIKDTREVASALLDQWVAKKG